MNPLEYDKAFIEHIRKVWPNTVYAPTDLAFKRSAELNPMEKIKLPLVSLYRTTGYEVVTGELRPYSLRQGRTVAVTQQGKLSKTKTIQVRLPYNIDIWAERREDLEEFTKELIFYILENPTIEVTVPLTKQGNPSETINFSASFFIESGPEDNSDLMSEENLGRIFRYTITGAIPEAQLFSISDAEYWKSILTDFHIT